MKFFFKLNIWPRSQKSGISASIQSFCITTASFTAERVCQHHHLPQSSSTLDYQIFTESTVSSGHATVTQNHTITPQIPTSQAYGPETY